MIYFFLIYIKINILWYYIYSMKTTKTAFYSSCFYWYADINISVDDFEKEFKQIYNIYLS